MVEFLRIVAIMVKRNVKQQMGLLQAFVGITDNQSQSIYSQGVMFELPLTDNSGIGM